MARGWWARSLPFGLCCDSARFRSSWRASEKPEDLPGAIERALANTPATVDVVTSQTVVSSDPTKGLGFVPEFQTLTASGALSVRKNRSPCRSRVRPT
jgi:hypothetical protein